MEKALKHLKKDPVMRELIKKHGTLQVKKNRRNHLESLIRSIINQQLSDKAAATIYERFKNLFPDKSYPDPKRIIKIPDKKIREAGISFPKIKYIKGLCKAIVKREVDLDNIHKLTDEEVTEELTKLLGIGKWTSEMFLMSSLGRFDVFAIGDLGLRKAISILYKVDRDDLGKIEKISISWKPYRSIASRYLWRSLD